MPVEKFHVPFASAATVPYQRISVKNLNGAVGFCRSRHRGVICCEDFIANDSSVRRQSGDCGSGRGRHIDINNEGGRARAGIADSVVSRRRELMGAFDKCSCPEAPRSAGIGRRRAQQGGAVIDRNRPAGCRRAGQGQTFALVMPSPTTPVSLANEAITGALGATVSTVTLSAAEAPLVLPAASVAFAVKAWAPSARVAVAKLHVPLALAVAVPSRVAPS